MSNPQDDFSIAPKPESPAPESRGWQANGDLWMECPICHGSKMVNTMEHGQCRCGHCQATGRVLVGIRSLKMH